MPTAWQTAVWAIVFAAVHVAQCAVPTPSSVAVLKPSTSLATGDLGAYISVWLRLISFRDARGQVSVPANSDANEAQPWAESTAFVHVFWNATGLFVTTAGPEDTKAWGCGQCWTLTLAQSAAVSSHAGWHHMVLSLTPTGLLHASLDSLSVPLTDGACVPCQASHDLPERLMLGTQLQGSQKACAMEVGDVGWWTTAILPETAIMLSDLGPHGLGTAPQLCQAARQSSPGEHVMKASMVPQQEHLAAVWAVSSSMATPQAQSTSSFGDVCSLLSNSGSITYPGLVTPSGLTAAAVVPWWQHRVRVRLPGRLLGELDGDGVKVQTILGLSLGLVGAAFIAFFLALHLWRMHKNMQALQNMLHTVLSQSTQAKSQAGGLGSANEMLLQAQLTQGGNDSGSNRSPLINTTSLRQHVLSNSLGGGSGVSRFSSTMDMNRSYTPQHQRQMLQQGHHHQQQNQFPQQQMLPQDGLFNREAYMMAGSSSALNSTHGASTGLREGYAGNDPGCSEMVGMASTQYPPPRGVSGSGGGLVPANMYPDAPPGVWHSQQMYLSPFSQVRSSMDSAVSPMVAQTSSRQTLPSVPLRESELALSPTSTAPTPSSNYSRTPSSLPQGSGTFATPPPVHPPSTIPSPMTSGITSPMTPYTQPDDPGAPQQPWAAPAEISRAGPGIVAVANTLGDSPPGSGEASASASGNLGAGRDLKGLLSPFAQPLPASLSTIVEAESPHRSRPQSGVVDSPGSGSSKPAMTTVMESDISQERPSDPGEDDAGLAQLKTKGLGKVLDGLKNTLGAMFGSNSGSGANSPSFARSSTPEPTGTPPTPTTPGITTHPDSSVRGMNIGPQTILVNHALVAPNPPLLIATKASSQSGRSGNLSKLGPASADSDRKSPGQLRYDLNRKLPHLSDLSGSSSVPDSKISATTDTMSPASAHARQMSVFQPSVSSISYGASTINSNSFVNTTGPNSAAGSPDWNATQRVLLEGTSWSQRPLHGMPSEPVATAEQFTPALANQAFMQVSRTEPGNMDGNPVDREFRYPSPGEQYPTEGSAAEQQSPLARSSSRRSERAMQGRMDMRVGAAFLDQARPSESGSAVSLPLPQIQMPAAVYYGPDDGAPMQLRQQLLHARSTSVVSLHRTSARSNSNSDLDARNQSASQSYSGTVNGGASAAAQLRSHSAASTPQAVRQLAIYTNVSQSGTSSDGDRSPSPAISAPPPMGTMLAGPAYTGSPPATKLSTRGPGPLTVTIIPGADSAISPRMTKPSRLGSRLSIGSVGRPTNDYEVDPADASDTSPHERVRSAEAQNAPYLDRTSSNSSSRRQTIGARPPSRSRLDSMVNNVFSEPSSPSHHELVRANQGASTDGRETLPQATEATSEIRLGLNSESSSKLSRPSAFQMQNNNGSGNSRGRAPNVLTDAVSLGSWGRGTPHGSSQGSPHLETSSHGNASGSQLAPYSPIGVGTTASNSGASSAVNSAGPGSPAARPPSASMSMLGRPGTQSASPLSPAGTAPGPARLASPGPTSGPSDTRSGAASSTTSPITRPSLPANLHNVVAVKAAVRGMPARLASPLSSGIGRSSTFNELYNSDGLPGTTSTRRSSTAEHQSISDDMVSAARAHRQRSSHLSSESSVSPTAPQHKGSTDRTTGSTFSSHASVASSDVKSKVSWALPMTASVPDPDGDAPAPELSMHASSAVGSLKSLPMRGHSSGPDTRDSVDSPSGFPGHDSFGSPGLHEPTQASFSYHISPFAPVAVRELRSEPSAPVPDLAPVSQSGAAMEASEAPMWGASESPFHAIDLSDSESDDGLPVPLSAEDLDLPQLMPVTEGQVACLTARPITISAGGIAPDGRFLSGDEEPDLGHLMVDALQALEQDCPSQMAWGDTFGLASMDSSTYPHPRHTSGGVSRAVSHTNTHRSSAGTGSLIHAAPSTTSTQSTGPDDPVNTVFDVGRHSPGQSTPFRSSAAFRAVREPEAAAEPQGFGSLQQAQNSPEGFGNAVQAFNSPGEQASGSPVVTRASTMSLVETGSTLDEARDLRRALGHQSRGREQRVPSATSMHSLQMDSGNIPSPQLPPTPPHLRVQTARQPRHTFTGASSLSGALPSPSAFAVPASQLLPHVQMFTPVMVAPSRSHRITINGAGPVLPTARPPLGPSAIALGPHGALGMTHSHFMHRHADSYSGAIHMMNSVQGVPHMLDAQRSEHIWDHQLPQGMGMRPQQPYMGFEHAAENPGSPALHRGLTPMNSNGLRRTRSTSNLGTDPAASGGIPAHMYDSDRPTGGPSSMHAAAMANMMGMASSARFQYGAGELLQPAIASMRSRQQPQLSMSGAPWQAGPPPTPPYDYPYSMGGFAGLPGLAAYPMANMSSHMSLASPLPHMQAMDMGGEVVYVLNVEQKEDGGGEHDVTAVTVNDPVRADVQLDMELNVDITIVGEEPLGTGAFGSVYSGLYHGTMVAVKFAHKAAKGACVSKEALETLQHEVRVLSRVRHPNVVTFFGACLKDPVFIVEELLQSDLQQLVHTRTDLLPLDDVLRIGNDIAKGLWGLHPTIVHRDLKPANVLLDHKGTAKISDFGMARFKICNAAETKNGDAGTIAYMAPECFDNKQITAKADVYSWAIIMWEMLTGQMPWYGMSNHIIMMNVCVRKERPELPENPQRCPPEVATLINDCWQQEPERRPSTGDICKQMSIIIKERDWKRNEDARA